MDFTGKSDPYAILKVKGDGDKKFKTVGRTETINNNPNPAFKKVFEVDYYFERNQEILVEVYDADSDDDDDLIGEKYCKINKLLTANRKAVKERLTLPPEMKNDKK